MDKDGSLVKEEVWQAAIRAKEAGVGDPSPRPGQQAEAATARGTNRTDWFS